MLKGIDISHHNEAFIKKDPSYLRKQDFIIMKASEGISFTDKEKERYIELAGRDMPIGFYHYARPDRGNPPEMEAGFFINSIAKYIKTAILVLDVEADALLYPDLDSWVYRWLETVRAVTGVKPLVYCSESLCYRFKLAAKNDFGLWVAKWSENKPAKGKIKPWKFWALWQYKIEGVDQDYFNGDLAAWNAYALGGD